MVPTCRHCVAVVLSLATVLSVVAGVAVLGVAPVAADQHTKDTAADYTEEASLRVEFPFATDHYPGDVNEGNGSIQYFASGEDAFAEVTDEEGVYLDFVIIDADWIDYSECSTDNTAAFGIDRGNDNDGTRIDEDLVQYQNEVDFRDDGLTIDFYSFEDFANDPPYMESQDAVVAEQGARSSGGACLTVTDEPGWYQLQGFINGTEADNGQGEPPSENAKRAGINAKSNYLYVCECDSRAEAEEKLGPAPEGPGSDGDGDPTPTPTDTPEGGTDTPTPNEETSTPEPTTEPAPTETLESAGTEDEDTATPARTTDGGVGGDGSDGPDEPDGPAAENATPTPGDGPGFTGLLALAALLATAALVHRRR